MKYFGRAFGALFLCLALAACVADDASITGFEIERGVYNKAEQTPYIKKIHFRDGKEKSFVSGSVKFEDGKPVISYAAGGVKAFEGQKARAEVHKALSAAGANVAPAALDIILKTLGGL